MTEIFQTDNTNYPRIIINEIENSVKNIIDNTYEYIISMCETQNIKNDKIILDLCNKSYITSELMRFNDIIYKIYSLRGSIPQYIGTSDIYPFSHPLVTISNTLIPLMNDIKNTIQFIERLDYKQIITKKGQLDGFYDKYINRYNEIKREFDPALNALKNYLKRTNSQRQLREFLKRETEKNRRQQQQIQGQPPLPSGPPPLPPGPPPSRQIYGSRGGKTRKNRHYT
jgi:hypothetical protein